MRKKHEENDESKKTGFKEKMKNALRFGKNKHRHKYDTTPPLFTNRDGEKEPETFSYVKSATTQPDKTPPMAVPGWNPQKTDPRKPGVRFAIGEKNTPRKPSDTSSDTTQTPPSDDTDKLLGSTTSSFVEPSVITEKLFDDAPGNAPQPAPSVSSIQSQHAVNDLLEKLFDPTALLTTSMIHRPLGPTLRHPIHPPESAPPELPPPPKGSPPKDTFANEEGWIFNAPEEVTPVEEDAADTWTGLVRPPSGNTPWTATVLTSNGEQGIGK